MQFIFSIKPGFFRLALALIVVLYHLTKFVFIGGFAVYCFFVLSGYWVMRMYSEKYCQLKKSSLNFYISRIIRIYPLYITMTLLALLMNWAYTASYFDLIKTYSVLNWTTVFGLIGYNTGPWVIPPAWSLDIEMQFYVLVPLLWLLISKFKKINSLLLVSFLIWINHCFAIIDIGMPIKHTVLPFLFYFLLGAKLFLSPKIFSEKQVYISLFLFVGVVLLHYFLPDLRFKVIGKNDLVYFEQINLLLPFLLLPFISYNLKVVSDQKDRHYGNLSYTVYLFHWVLIIPYNYFIADLSFIQRLPLSVLYVVITIVLADLILKYFEVPIQQQLKRIGK